MILWIPTANDTIYFIFGKHIASHWETHLETQIREFWKILNFTNQKFRN